MEKSCRTCFFGDENYSIIKKRYPAISAELWNKTCLECVHSDTDDAEAGDNYMDIA